MLENRRGDDDDDDDVAAAAANGRNSRLRAALANITDWQVY